MELIEVTFRASGRQKWMSSITSTYKAKFRLLHSKPSRKKDEVLQLLEMTVDRGMREKALKYLRNNREISEFEATDSSHGRLFGLMRARGVIMRCIADSDCFLVSASGAQDLPISWKVLGTKRAVRELLLGLQRREIVYDVVDIAAVRRKSILTARQEWLLHSAFEEGYFDSPKKIHLRKLASRIGVAAPTLHQSLRSTQRRLIEDHLAKSPEFPG